MQVKGNWEVKAAGRELSAGRSSRGQIDDTAGDVQILVDGVAGTDAMVAIGNHEPPALGRISAKQEHRRELDSLPDLLEVASNRRIRRGQEKQLGCSKQIPRLAMRCSRLPQLI